MQVFMQNNFVLKPRFIYPLRGNRGLMRRRFLLIFMPYGQFLGDILLIKIFLSQVFDGFASFV